MAIKDSSIKCKIDSSDMDNYAHLNNAAFPKYFEKGRADLAAGNYLDRDSLSSMNLAFLVKRAFYDYITPVLGNQEVDIRSKVVLVKGAKVFVEQEMLYDGKTVSTCVAEYFFMDLKRKKPTKPPYSVFQNIDIINTKA